MIMLNIVPKEFPLWLKERLSSHQREDHWFQEMYGYPLETHPILTGCKSVTVQVVSVQVIHMLKNKESCLLGVTTL
jgi:hypothetical protein